MTREEIIKRWALTYYKKMFEGCPLGREDLLTRVSTSRIKKITTFTGQFKLTFLEQNPGKASMFGERARNGHKIMWFVARKKGGRERWLGRVEDGKWFPSLIWQ